MIHSLFDRKLPTLWLAAFYCLFFSTASCITTQAATKQQRPFSQGIKQAERTDSVQKRKPSILTIKAFAVNISKPLLSAEATIRSKSTGMSERVAVSNGKLERTFMVPDELFIEVSAEGYKSAKRTMTIAVSPQGNHYEFDAALDQISIGLTVWAVDRQTGKIIPGARFTLNRQATGPASVSLMSDSTTGLSKINLPSKGVYVLSSMAGGYTNFVKSIKLDSVQNEARFILQAKQTTVPVKPLSSQITTGATPTVNPVAKTASATPVTTTTLPIAAVTPQSVGNAEKGRPMQLSNLYFDQSSPVLRPESYPELDQLADALNKNPAMQIDIRGHTDNQGDFDLNVKLSRDRCQAIVDYLISKGIAKNRLKAIGRGPIDPVAPNTTEENRRKNRRVEFVVR